jgi:hypothetical protein
LSWIVSIVQIVWENIIAEQASPVHFYWVINSDLEGSERACIPEYGEQPGRKLDGASPGWIANVGLTAGSEAQRGGSGSCPPLFTGIAVSELRPPFGSGCRIDRMFQ